METFESYLASSQKQRDALFAHSKSPIPTDKGDLGDDIELSIRAAEAAGAQLAKMRYYLTSALKEAMLYAREKAPEYTVKEKDILVRDYVKDIQLLHDEVENLARSLNSRVKAECNGRRSLL